MTTHHARFEYFQAGRGAGKTYYLAQKAAEAQDAGADLCVVVVHNSAQVDYWYDLLWTVGIDPSRFMILLPGQANKVPGQTVTFVGVDNADLMDPEILGRIVKELLTSDPDPHPTITYRDPTWEGLYL